MVSVVAAAAMRSCAVAAQLHPGRATPAAPQRHCNSAGVCNRTTALQNCGAHHRVEGVEVDPKVGATLDQTGSVHRGAEG